MVRLLVTPKSPMVIYMPVKVSAEKTPIVTIKNTLY